MDVRCWRGWCGCAGEARPERGSNIVLRLAKCFIAGGERGSPRAAGCGKTLKNLPASGVYDESLTARGAGADVGEIDPRPANERRCQHVSLRFEIPFDLAGKRDSPTRRPLSRRGRNESDGDERADR